MKTLLSLKTLKVLVISILLFIFLDMLWLALIASDLYYDQLGYLANTIGGKVQFNLPVGLGVQAIIASGLALIISLSLRVENTLSNSLITGAFLGFVLYCTYDLTNLSFVKGYPLLITVVDIAWGTFQGFAAGFYVFYLNGGNKRS